MTVTPSDTKNNKGEFTMRKCTAVCYIDSEYKFINAFAIHTANCHLIDLSHILKGYYENTFDLVTYLVNLAKVNGFEIPYYEMFGAKCYDIMFIDSKVAFAVNRYFIAG